MKTIFYSMSDDFDFDDLLDDVLDEFIPTNLPQPSTAANSAMFPTQPPVPAQPASKYKRLQCLPPELEKEWERIIEVDEVVMKLRGSKPLSNAYTMSKGSVSETELTSYFHHLMEKCIGSDEKGQALLQAMEKDSTLMNAFRTEMIKQVRATVSVNDPDIASDRYKDLKDVLSM